MAKEKSAPAAAAQDSKKQAINTAMQQIERMYGKGSIMRFGDGAELNVECIPTGSLGLDLALGVGGLPRGRIVEIYGPESSGKTTLALHVIAEAQKKGGEVAFVDAEHALDPTYARALGVRVEDMLISQPDTGEQAWRSPRPWSAPAPLTWWWWTAWRLSCPGRRSRARWATASWVSTPGS